MSKIIIKYDEWARLGNRMFLFAFAKILADKKQAELYGSPLLNFPNTHNINSNIPETLNNPISVKAVYGSHSVNYDELLNTNRDIIVDSYLQRSEYYIQDREQIKQWFMIPNADMYAAPEKSELVVHIRETDYKTLGILLNEKFYIEGLTKLAALINATKITVVTDNCNAPIIKTLSDTGINILSNVPVNTFMHSIDEPMIRDYMYMLKSNYLLISQSSFSWWAAFLGDHSKVYFPVTNNKSMWKMHPDKTDIDLFIDGKFDKILV